MKPIKILCLIAAVAFWLVSGNTTGFGENVPNSKTTREMETIAAFHARHQRLTETLLRDAFGQAESPTIPHVLFQLQSLLDERNV